MPARPLPGEIGFAGSDVEVIRDEPFAVGAEVDAALDADDAIPVLNVRFAGALATGTHDRSDVRAELPPEFFLDVDQPRAREEIERRLRRADRVVGAGERPHPAFDVELSRSGHPGRQLHAADREVARVGFGSADVHVDDVGEHAPSAPARLERSHEDELQVVEDRVRAHVDAAARSRGKGRRAPDVGEVTVEDRLEPPGIRR